MNPKEPIFLSRSFVFTEGSIPSLRGKVLSDNTPDISSLRASLLHDWRPHGEVKISPLSDGTFLVQFYEVQDVVKVWNSGPWFYNDDLFLLQPDIHTVHQLQFTKARFWVEFHGLPWEYLSTSTACALATRIGEPMEFSSPSYIPGQVGSMRVQIQIDVTKPLIPSLPVVLEDGSHVVVSVNYGRLPRLCRLCRVLGHELERCGHTRNGQTKKMNTSNVPNDLTSNVSHGSTSASSAILSHTPDSPLVTANLHKPDSTEASAQTVLEDANNCLPVKRIFKKLLRPWLQIRRRTNSSVMHITTDATPPESSHLLPPAHPAGALCLGPSPRHPDGALSTRRGTVAVQPGGSPYSKRRSSTTGPSRFQLCGDVQPRSDSGVGLRVKLTIKIPIIETRHLSRTMALICEQPGVESVKFLGRDRCLFVVIGSNLDPVIMLRYLMSGIGAIELFPLRKVPRSEMSSNIESSSPVRFQDLTLQLIDENCARPYSP